MNLPLEYMEKMKALLGEEYDDYIPYSTNCQPLTAPIVKPLMKYFWKKG